MRWALIFAFIMACGDSPVPVDSGPVLIDGALPDGRVGGADQDGDGVCDATENMRGTDPLRADTDDDGLSDYAEILLGSNPSLSTSPDPATIHILRESEVATLQLLVERTVFGQGEDFRGAFESVPVRDGLDHSAGTFYTGSIAAFAVPTENVANIDGPAEFIQSVNGRTLITYEISFGYGATAPRGCTRLYPFLYTIKRSDGSIVARQRQTLLILPPGETTATSPWCVPNDCI